METKTETTSDSINAKLNWHLYQEFERVKKLPECQGLDINRDRDWIMDLAAQKLDVPAWKLSAIADIADYNPEILTLDGGDEIEPQPLYRLYVEMHAPDQILTGANVNAVMEYKKPDGPYLYYKSQDGYMAFCCDGTRAMLWRFADVGIKVPLEILGQMLHIERWYQGRNDAPGSYEEEIAGEVGSDLKLELWGLFIKHGLTIIDVTERDIRGNLIHGPANQDKPE